MKKENKHLLYGGHNAGDTALEVQKEVILLIRQLRH